MLKKTYRHLIFQVVFTLKWNRSEIILKLYENGLVFNTYYIIKCCKSRENIGDDHCSCNFELSLLIKIVCNK